MRLITVAIVLGIAGLVFSCNSENSNTDSETKKDSMTTTTTEAHNVLSEAEAKEGWVLLFDGTSKKNWHIYNNRSNGAAWAAVDGALHLDPK